MTAAAFSAWRERLGLTQAGAGRLLGLTVRPDGSTCDAVAHYESGRRGVSDTVARLCRYVDLYGPLPDDPTVSDDDAPGKN